MKNPEEHAEIQVHPRPVQTVSLQMPADTLVSLKKVGAIRDMSEQALIKFYVGRGLREDLARLRSERMLEATAEVLARHLDSAEELSEIMREIRQEAIPPPQE